MNEIEKYLEACDTDLVGDWIVEHGRVVGDVTCQRILWLIAYYLQKVSDSPESGAWETAYRDPKDGRYWERTYPQGEMHGGGPPRLHVLKPAEFERKYKVR